MIHYFYKHPVMDFAEPSSYNSRQIWPVTSLWPGSEWW